LAAFPSQEWSVVQNRAAARRITVALARPLVEARPDDVAIAIDVLRATTTLAVLFERGCRGVWLASGVDAARAAGRAVALDDLAQTLPLVDLAGALPAWLAPGQVVVLNITQDQDDYARQVAKSLQKQGLRVEFDLRNEKITRKIREHSMQKVPFLLVVGDKEKANGTVAVRARGNQDLGVMPLADFQAKISSDIALKV
jgi:hypothetical protein